MHAHALLNLGLFLAALAIGAAVCSAAIRWLLEAWWRRQDRKTAERIDARTRRLAALRDLSPMEPWR